MISSLKKEDKEQKYQSNRDDIINHLSNFDNIILGDKLVEINIGKFHHNDISRTISELTNDKGSYNIITGVSGKSSFENSVYFTVDRGTFDEFKKACRQSTNNAPQSETHHQDRLSNSKNEIGITIL